MALVVAFASKTPVTISGSRPGYAVWNYRIEPGSQGELQQGHRVGLVLPAAIDIRDPALNPEIPALSGMFLRHIAAANRQYLGRKIVAAGPQTLSFVAPDRPGQCEMLLVVGASEQNWMPVPFATATGGATDLTQLITAPAQTLPGAPPPVYTGRPVTDFAGALPYASELFGVYQPLTAGWIGMRNTLRHAAGLPTGGDLTPTAFRGTEARSLAFESIGAAGGLEPMRSLVSPIGMVNLFRQYFFEFDSFLGAPVGHVWVAAGGTVEVVESSTRRTLIERTAEQSEQVTRKSEESLTAQEDVVDAVKQENANDTKMGVSASGGVNYGVFHGEATASLSSDSSAKRSSEQTHKQTRTQSAKVSSEITRNFKTTFKTVTEATDTTSRRYVVQNTTDHVQNYELRRKMRKIGVQLQHIGTRMCWQVFLDDPGRDFGLGELVQTIAAPDLSALHKPEPPAGLEAKETPFTGVFPVRKWPGSQNPIPPNEDFPFRNADDGPEPNRILSHNRNDHAVADVDLSAPLPAPGYVLDSVRLLGAKSGGADTKFVPAQPIKVLDGATGTFKVMANFFNSGDANTITLSFTLTWKPPLVHPGQAAYDRALDEYNQRAAEVQRAAYAEAIRQRLKSASAVRPRPTDDLRDEERKSVYGQLLHQLRIFPDDPATTSDDHLTSELIQQIFDVDEMLYFAAPDYWRPKDQNTHPGQATVGRYPVPPKPPVPGSDLMDGQTVLSWYSHTDQHNEIGHDLSAQARWRVNYLITEDTQPAPKGSSLGWLVQLDGDERRNEFLNAAWVKAVLPVRPGHEKAALSWLKEVEGVAGLDVPYEVKQGDPTTYQGKKVGEVLDLLMDSLQVANTDMSKTLAAEKVFEHGFDPLEDGFRPATPYEVFTQWTEVLPTDQIAAAEVRYDPATGQQF